MGGGKSLSLIIYVSLAIGLGLTIWSYYAFMQTDLDPTVVPERKLNGWLFRPYFLMVVGFSVLMAWIIGLDRMKHIRKLLSWIGAMSLEVYLLHGQFIALARGITDEYGLSKPLVGGAMVILSFFVAYAVHVANKRVISTIQKI